jgi:hypothetical protein
MKSFYDESTQFLEILFCILRVVGAFWSNCVSKIGSSPVSRWKTQLNWTPRLSYFEARVSSSEDGRRTNIRNVTVSEMSENEESPK